MSRGPGAIERAILELFAIANGRPSDPDFEDGRSAPLLGAARLRAISARVFGGPTPTRAKRNSVIRAAHRVIRRLGEINARCHRGVRRHVPSATRRTSLRAMGYA
jgi:hypothetical protein